MPTGPAGDEFLPPSDPKKKGTPRRAGTVAQPHVLKDEGVDPIEQAKADAEFAAWRVERKQRRAREAEGRRRAAEADTHFQAAQEALGGQEER